MEISDLEFPNLLQNALSSLGIPPAILVCVALVYLIRSWLEAKEDAIKIARLAQRVSRGLGPSAIRIVRTFASIPALRLTAAFAASVLTVIAQVLTVLLCFVVGNWFSLVFGKHADTACTSHHRHRM